MKSFFDIILASILMIAFSPLMVIVAIIVMVSLGKPVLFRQRRPGLDGKPFVMYKFRTMNERIDYTGKLLSDAERMTRVGTFMRKYSLDELPQLWNVIMGDMSFIGPRPLLMDYMPLYNISQKRRHEVKPGITGWAQINGRNELSWEEKLRLDVWYVDNRSFLLDIKIVFLTFVYVLKAKGVNRKGYVTAPMIKQENDSQEGA